MNENIEHFEHNINRFDFKKKFECFFFGPGFIITLMNKLLLVI